MPMPSVARCMKVARLAVRHLGPPLTRGVVSVAGGVFGTMIANAKRPLSWDEEMSYRETAEDKLEGRQPGDLDFGTNYLPERDDPCHPCYWFKQN